jgi:ATP-binding cassette subfamily F protein 3
VAELSGGEKARLLLGLATFAGPHLVILDEPTNHLDIDSRAALVEAINGFAGAVVLVSHDRYLLDACAERLWLVADGTVSTFDGDLDDYRRGILTGRGSPRAADGGEASSAPRVSRTEARRSAAEKRAELAPLRTRIAAAETTIKRLTDEIARIDRALMAPDLFGRNPAGAAALAKARAAAARSLASAEEEWLEASTQYDSAIA